MNNDYLYLETLKIAHECREKLISDTLNEDAQDLYDALYESGDREISEVKFELYEIGWLELHWEKFLEILDKNEYSSTEKRKLLLKIENWYQNYIENWDYTTFEALAFEEKRNVLKELIATDARWNENLKKMKVSFARSKKLLQYKIKQLETKGQE